VTPIGLLAVALLASLVSAVFGAAPLAAWAASVPVLPQATETWQDLTQTLSLDRPYDVLRKAIRNAENAKFGAAD
jgi:hypothetical protein